MVWIFKDPKWVEVFDYNAPWVYVTENKYYTSTKKSWGFGAYTKNSLKRGDWNEYLYYANDYYKSDRLIKELDRMSNDDFKRTWGNPYRVYKRSKWEV